MIYSTIYYAWRNAIQRTWPKLAYLFLRFLSFSLSRLPKDSKTVTVLASLHSTDRKRDSQKRFTDRLVFDVSALLSRLTNFHLDADLPPFPPPHSPRKGGLSLLAADGYSIAAGGHQSNHSRRYPVPADRSSMLRGG